MQYNTFQNWVQTKKVQPNDLRFLSLLPAPEQKDLFHQHTDIFFATAPSFSEGLQVLELVVDLILLKRDSEIPVLAVADRNQAVQKISEWRAQLHKLRYPSTSGNDDQRKQILENLNWPTGAKTKVERRGDRHGVELKIFISSSTDVTKLISNLERIKNDFPV